MTIATTCAIGACAGSHRFAYGAGDMSTSPVDGARERV
jgi:hypothetical protein